MTHPTPARRPWKRLQPVAMAVPLLAAAIALAACALVPPPMAAGISVTKLGISGNFWTNTAWNDPHVVKLVGGSYLMFLSRSCSDLYPDGRAEPVSIFCAASPDGIDWTIQPGELLGLGGSADWDYNKAETPSVVWFEGSWRMFYSGGSQADPRYAIGRATSSSPTAGWHKDSGPLISPNSFMAATGQTGVLHVAEPGALVVNGAGGPTLHLYFTVTSRRSDASGLSNKMTLWLTTSRDGITFDTPRLVLEQGPAYPAASGYCGYSTPSALQGPNGIELYYDVYRHTGGAIAPDEQVALHRAVSADGVHFTEDAAPLLSRENLAWTAREIRGGSELLEGGTVRMWFSGDDYRQEMGTWKGGMNFGLASWPTAIGPHGRG